MNRWNVFTIVLMCAIAAPLFAQPASEPPPGQPGQPNQPNQPNNPNPRNDQPLGVQGRQGGRGGGGGFSGGGFNQPGQPPQNQPFRQGPGPDMQKYEMLRNYIDVVDRFTKLTSDPTAAGIAAVVEATDILRQRGQDTAIAYLEKSLGEVKSLPVQRAIRIQLADLYRQSGQADKAVAQLDVLMKNASSP